MMLTKHLEVDLDGDAYVAHVRSPLPQVLINDGYTGVVAIDAVTGERRLHVAFPDDDYSIYCWLVSPRGDTSYTFGEGPGTPIFRVDHVQATAAPIAAPAGFGIPSELCWFAPDLVVVDYEDRVWSIEGSSLRPAAPSEIDALYSAHDRLVTRNYAVVKTDPYGRGLYVRSREYAKKSVGFIPSVAGEPSLLVEQDGTAIDVARFEATLFVLFESSLIEHGSRGERIALTAPEETFFVRVNVVEVAGVGYLTVLSSGEDHLQRAKGRLTVYRLSDG